jgi:DNA-binding Xre family transcriptional regulator
MVSIFRGAYQVAKKRIVTNGRGPVKAPANYLRAWRLFRGYASQGDLAKASGITRATICRLESGAMPYRQWLLEKLAKVLDCAPVDLIGTDPTAQVTIAQIYRRLSEDDRKRALKYLAGLAGK